MQWYMRVIKQYATFDGRASRTEFWMFVLINALFVLGISLLRLIGLGLGILLSLYSLAMIIPGWALQVRRLHDTNHSGWWIFIGLVPLVGAIILLVFNLLPGDFDTNLYGTPPPPMVP